MSIFKATFPEGVREQLKTRQKAMAKRDATAITYLNSRTAWIRMTSAVDVKGSSDLAKNNILLGGALYNNSLRTGIGTTGENAYSTNTANGSKHRLGMRPMPGITSIEVKNRGAYGSLREITVSFQCWDIKQLEELELLYMRPDYSVLVEWGWMPYLTNSGGLSNVTKLTDDVLNGKTTKEEIWKKIFKNAAEDGNYDAIYGFVKNYSWKTRSDGGYDCTTSLMTMGEVLESLKINYVSDANILKSNGRGFFGFLDITSFFKETPVNKSYSQNKLAGMLNEIWDIAVNFKKISDKTATSFELKGTSYDFFRYDLTVANRQPAAKDSFVEEDQQIYITLEGFVDLMNKYILLEDTAAKKPLAALSVKEGAHNGGEEGDPLLCLAHRFQLSIDPTICLIKNPKWATPKESLGISSNSTDFETIKTIMTNLGKDYFKTSDDGGLFGIIGNIYVNIGYLYGLIVSDDLASQDSKEKKDINLYDYMKNVLSGINTSIGNVATLELFMDPVDSIGRIIDLNYVDMKSRANVYENAFPIEIHNLKSTVRSYSLESHMLPEQASIIAMGAQVEGGALGSDSNTMAGFNKGLRDRIIPVKKAPGDNEENKLNNKIESLKNSLEIMLSYINKTDPSWYEHAGDFDVSDASKYANALRDLIQFDRSLLQDNNKNRGIIPTKLSLEMDGIGGIVVGNIFKVNEDILPKGYRGIDGIGAKIGYAVTEIGASINESNDWVTKIGAQFVLLDKPGGEASSVWDDVKNTIIETAQIVQEVEQAAEVAKVLINTLGKGPGILEVRDKVGASPYPGDINFNTIYKNAEIPISQMVAIEDGGLKRYGGKYLLHPEAASQYLLMKAVAQAAGIKWRVTSAYRDRAHQASLGSSSTVAGVGSSPHGWGGAIDFGELYKAADGSGSPSVNAAVRASNSLYKWLAENGPKYGWYNPYRLADNRGTDECWHFEYWGPNVRKNSFSSNNVTPSKSPLSNTKNVNAILIGGLDYRTGDKSIEEQITLLKKGYGENTKVEGFRYNIPFSEISISSFIAENPNIDVFLFSAGCDLADEVAGSKSIDKNRIYIIEPYAEKGNSNVVKAVNLGVPASNVFVGPVKARGKDVVKGAVSSESSTHWGALQSVGSKVYS